MCKASPSYPAASVRHSVPEEGDVPTAEIVEGASVVVACAIMVEYAELWWAVVSLQ